MKLPAARRPSRTDIDMVPMINFAFLLLIFFMLAGTLAPAQKIPLDPPRSSAAAPVDPAGDVLTIAADGRMGLGDDPLTETGLPARIAQWRQQHPHQGLRIKADAATDSANVIRIMQLLRASGIEQISLLTVRGTP